MQRARPAHDRDQRIALGTVFQHVYTDVAEASSFKIEAYECGMPAGVARPPDRYCLGWKAPIGEADDEDCTRPQDPKDLSEDLQGTL